MREAAQIHLLADGRLYLHDGPIDLIVAAFGERGEKESAYRAAAERFVTILDELCEELSVLRQPAALGKILPKGSTARRMASAVQPFAQKYFITPMAAVAGAVAEEILVAMTTAASLSRAYVNDGGDIALHLAPGEHLVAGMMDRPDRPSLFGTVTFDADQKTRGIATSGWRGRSFSLGIADAVTVLAEHAACADAAATLVANAVDLPGHRGIGRQPACDLSPDSDLGHRLVTQSVPVLRWDEVDQALSAGIAVAEDFILQGLIQSAALHLQGETRIVGMHEPGGPSVPSRRVAYA